MIYVILTRREDRQERNEREAAWLGSIDLQRKTVCESMALMTQAMNKLVDNFSLYDKRVEASFAVLMDREKLRRESNKS